MLIYDYIYYSSSSNPGRIILKNIVSNIQCCFETIFSIAIFLFTNINNLKSNKLRANHNIFRNSFCFLESFVNINVLLSSFFLLVKKFSIIGIDVSLFSLRQQKTSNNFLILPPKPPYHINIFSSCVYISFSFIGIDVRVF